MIGNIEHGILMRTNTSWSIDDHRNKFQFGCEFGQLIENGKLPRSSNSRITAAFRRISGAA
jgi:Predicted Zn-dependent proteases and their inactivated homologs